MLPLYLSIEGLYSYQSKQEIDFTALTAAGLFGIFGKVGSGKSTILEAITFALFANTNRLNSNNRAYNMMNLNSNQLRIEFHFIGKENKKYAFEASWRRNSKQFEKVTTPVRKAYVFEGDEKIPLESTDAETILGISYKNFNRTVIVPQGQFKEFLELKGAERSGMMKELFNLDHYDLFYKVASLSKETELKLQNISGAVQTLEDYTEESIAELLLQLENEQLKLQEVTNTHQQLDQQHQKLLEVQQFHKEIAIQKQAFAQLSAEQGTIENLKKQILLFQKVDRIFKHALDNLADLQTEEFQLTQDFARTKHQLNAVHTALLTANSAYKIVEQDFNQLDNKRIAVEDMRNIVHILKLQVDIKKEAERLANGQIVLQGVDQQILNKQTLVQEKQQEITNLKASRVASSLLMTINDWYSKQEQYIKTQHDLEADLKIKRKDYQDIILQFEKESLTPTSWREKLTEDEKSASILLERLQSNENKIQVKQQLANFSHALTAGEACPLCGSEHHPHIMQTEDVSEQLVKFKSEKTHVQETILQIQQRQQRFIQLDANLITLQRDIDKSVEKLNTLTIELNHHLTQFTWTNFQHNDRTSFDQWKLQAESIEQACTLAESTLAAIQKELDDLKIKKEKYSNGLNSIALTKSTLEGRSSIHEQLIKRLKLSEFEQFAISEIEILITQSLQSIDHIEQEYSRLLNEINQFNISIASLSTTSNTLEMQLKNKQSKITLQQKLLEELLQQHDFVSLDAVKEILKQQYDLEKEELRIKRFEEHFAIVKANLVQLEQKINQQAVDISQITKISQDLQLAKEAKEMLIGQLQSLKDQILISKKRYAEKVELQIAFDKLALRNKNLSILSNLFKGNGFVDYISTQYLEDLCHIANHRFERLTRGHLKLIINSENDFEVMDHLNGGKSRSVRTLSGGQFFQASLCLALALAESTRSLNQNEKNFFFIDEGFGTQDTESVNLIFETLNALHKENRIVGIISHVDELQERIPVSVKIVKDEDLGSLILHDF
jgi:exonuclease SbcC